MLKKFLIHTPYKATIEIVVIKLKKLFNSVRFPEAVFLLLGYVTTIKLKLENVIKVQIFI